MLTRRHFIAGSVAVAAAGVGGPALALPQPIPSSGLDDFVEGGVLNPSIRDYLMEAAFSGRNIVITGPAASGKTTLLRELVKWVPEQQSVAIIEDAPELADIRSQSTLHMMMNGVPSWDECLEKTLTTALRADVDRIIYNGGLQRPLPLFRAAMETGQHGTMMAVSGATVDDAVWLLTRDIKGVDDSDRAARLAPVAPVIVQMGQWNRRVQVMAIGEVTGAGRLAERFRHDGCGGFEGLRST